MPSSRAEVSDIAISPDHYIGGRRVESGSTFQVRSPLDWDWKLADMARGDALTADRAITAAVDAFPAWSALAPQERAEHLHRLADLIDGNVDDIATVECADMAMLMESLQARVIHRGAENLRNYADLAAGHEGRRWSSKGTENFVQRMPAGPAVIITPWNAPWILSTWKLAPALAAGNTVILKPAEWAPLSASLLADLAHEAEIPPGVLNVVQGIGEEVGAALVGDRRVRRISFTGSPETARHIGVAAARNITPFTAELGGKGPFVVFADSDIDAAAKKAAGQFDDAGQVCLAGTRLLVEESVSREFLDRFDSYTDKHVLGDSRNPSTTISPLIHPEHLARVEGFVERARQAGDRILRGGHRWKDDGLWYEPTVIAPRTTIPRSCSGRCLARCSPFRPSATNRKPSHLPTPPNMDCPASSTQVRRKGHIGSDRRSGQALSGSTPSWYVTSPPPLAGAGSQASAGRAGITHSTSTAI
jgi:betaine-aldehyde dehydrogenase/5-carboxymethyl-2-hydroxymuconic-semialdehyde dehydrogenase